LRTTSVDAPTMKFGILSSRALIAASASQLRSSASPKNEFSPRLVSMYWLINIPVTPTRVFLHGSS
jgi:hypothetical protein